MTELIQLNIDGYDINKFDMDPASVQQRKFKDANGKENTYFEGDLTYDGKPPYFFVEGDSYGIQLAGNNKKEGAGGAPGAVPPAMIQLPSAPAPSLQARADGGAAGGAPGKKEKWQVAIKLSQQPAEKDWTPAERRVIDFIDNDLRKIQAHVLARRPEILMKVGSNIVSDAQERFRAEYSAPGAAQRFPDEATQMARLKEIIYELLVAKISRKVYRKKKDQQAGAPVNLLSANATQYDDTKHPTLYASIMSFVNKQTNTEEFITSYYKFIEGKEETEWPRLNHQEACDLGWQRVQAGIRCDKTYFGASISCQLKAAELVMVKAISGGMGHKGRLVKAPADVVRNPRLVTRSAIQSSEGANSNIQPVVDPSAQHGIQPVQFSVAAGQPGVPPVFDPSVLQGIPGISGGAVPMVASNYGGFSVANNNNAQ